MNKSLTSYYEKKIKNKIETIERHQMKMNANLSNHSICHELERKQSLLRVDIIFLQRKIDELDSKYNKVA
jgi:FtsZ-binding cell division protein ZapB